MTTTSPFLTIPKPEDRLAWLRARSPYFNASDAATLYNAHPFKTLADVVVEKSTEVEDTPTNEDMERGQRLEPFLLQWWGDKHGFEVITPNLLYVCDRLMATLDGEPVGIEDTWIEAKTTRQRWDEVPPYVRYQVIAQAAASGKQTCYVVALDAEMRFKEWKIIPTAEEIEDLLDKVANFWSALDLGMQPEGVQFNAEQIAALHPEPVHDAAEINDEGFQAVVRFAQAKLARLDAEKAEKEAKDEVARLIGEKDALVYGDRVVCTWEAAPRTSLDVKRLQAELPEVTSKYQRTSYVRTMRLSKGLDDA